MKALLTRPIDRKFAISTLLGVFLLALLVIGYASFRVLQEFSSTQALVQNISRPLASASELALFQSEEEFKAYLAKSSSQFLSGMGRGAMEAPAPLMTPAPSIDQGAKTSVPSRVSETTVQVKGIDEPDIVKTDGKEIYFSSQPLVYYTMPKPMPLREGEVGIMPPYPEYQAKTKVIKAFPVADLKLDSEIEKNGNLLLSDNILVVFAGQEILGYDVADPAAPKKLWDIKLSDRTMLVDARMYNGALYVVTRDTVNTIHPCPLKPLSSRGTDLIIPCREIYHPIASALVDSTFVAMNIDPRTGAVNKKVSFAGSADLSVLYMSEHALYITYSLSESTFSFIVKFIEEKGKDLFPESIRTKITRLAAYDLSDQAKTTELQVILERYFASLDQDEVLRLQNEIANRMSDFYQAHKRDLEKTGIVQIPLGSFIVRAVGNVPGRPLNQFSLDEYQRNLRIATTVGEQWFGFGYGFHSQGQKSANDVYILNNDLEIQGSVKDLGLSERIYSVRFVEDKGYLVTFRQIDPFYVLDLSNPKNPQLKGELKIPGYSSYLEPITKDRILGIGQDDWKVKVSLFDVSNAANPKEIAKYTLDESWSEVLSTHHAFLLDTKHKIFFLPGGRGGYIFSYDQDQLKLVKAASQTAVKRAIYLDEYLYLIGEQEITVFDETNWQKIKTLEL